jgi:ADP-ribosylation factor-binding protein GGA
MGTTPPVQAYAPSPMASNGNGYGMGMLLGGGAPGMARPTMSPPQLSGTPPASIMLPGTPGPAPNYYGNNGYAAKGPVIAVGGGMGTGMAPSSSTQTQQRPPPPGTNTAPNNATQGKDPFADLAGLF